MIKYEHFTAEEMGAEMFCAFDIDGGFAEIVGAEYHAPENEWYYFATGEWCDSARADDHGYLLSVLIASGDSGFSCGSYDSLPALIEDNGADVLRHFI